MYDTKSNYQLIVLVLIDYTVLEHSYFIGRVAGVCVCVCVCVWGGGGGGEFGGVPTIFSCT